ncbi:MAG TPA: amino acid permease [Blastocatellia bacterium]|nr:amino acid permease [Blastocatellia bacterium]
MAHRQLLRGIRRWDLVALGINFVVGAGIVGLPSEVYRLSGPSSLIAYAVCAVVIISIVLCYAEVGSRFIQTGGPYIYAREAFGPFAGFGVGWLRFLSGVASFAANSHKMVDYLSYIWPAANTGYLRYFLITAVILSITAVNVVGVKDTAAISNIFAAGKLIPLLSFVAIGMFFITPQNISFHSPESYNDFSRSILILVYAFAGFESMTIPAAEVRDPQRTLPFALLVTISIVMLLYVSIQLVCIGTLPGLAESARPLTDASTRFLGTYGGYIITAAIVVSIAGNLIGQIVSTPRILFAMAEQGQLPQSIASIHDKFRTPYISILLSACIILGLALSGTFIQLAAISVIARIAMYASTCAALPILRRRGDVSPAAFRLPGGLVIAVVSVALCIWMLSTITSQEAIKTSIFLLIGFVIYLAYRKVRAVSPAKAEV